MSDVDLLIIQQAKYSMDMPTNVVRPADIPFAPHPKMCICFALDVSSTSRLCCYFDIAHMQFKIPPAGVFHHSYNMHNQEYSSNMHQRTSIVYTED